ncbi:MAG: hypothetical protein KJT03_22915 [Verrucomicrobiae bacterium]|nr:hypothetical protein [Verrucomicrobiae bacterium]
MKRKTLLILSCFSIGLCLRGQELTDEYATFSTFTAAPNPGIIYQIEKISTYGACATVEFREIHVPGAHPTVIAEYEEHLSIPVLSSDIEYIDGVTQFGEEVPGVFYWQDRIYESTPCPINYFTAPPSFILYEAPKAPMVNTSNRAEVSPDKMAIAGFVLRKPSWVIVRGIGPSMHMGEAALEDPVITLHADQYLLDDLNDDLENSISNDNWQDTLRTDTLEYWKLAPESEKESALVTYLNPGAYTVILEGNGGSGTGLVEVYLAPYSLPLE